MKLERIKKDKKKKIIIGSMIVLSVVGYLTLTTTRAKYRNVQSLKLASGTVKLNSYDFKIMAMKQSEDGETYTDINTMPETGYVINEDKSYCTIDNKTQVKGKLKTNSEGEHVFSKLNKNEKCYIWFDKYVAPPMTISDIIVSIETRTDGSYKGTKKPSFTKTATEAETEANNGIYVTDDSMYGTGKKTYYWRGAATTNHVIFDNKCWRIVRINGDKTIRLIYNGAVQSENSCKGNEEWDGNVVLKKTQYNLNDDNSSYVGWSYSVGSQRPSTNVPQTSGTRANVRIQLEDTWYKNNISDTAKSKIVAGKFCNDRNTKNNETWTQNGTNASQYYAAYGRLRQGTYTPTLACSNGDIYELKVGMITADEVQFAGAYSTASNSLFYLYNGQSYWTMTPAGWSYNGECKIFLVSGNSGINDTWATNNGNSTRPVINLRSDVTFNSDSDGTQNNPYIVQ